ncbi:Dynamin related protein 4C [Perilla frutescens var. hirtella]|nr:Dynamin related protein 4C [Perilla frutescens var. hirtella]
MIAINQTSDHSSASAFLVTDTSALKTKQTSSMKSSTQLKRSTKKRKRSQNTPLTLVVKKKGVLDFTMIYLLGIARVPNYSQPEDIYEQVSNIIMEYIAPEESIILNVLLVSVNFSTHESIRISHHVNREGEMTLTVVTEANKLLEGLLEMVIADDVNIGLDYICVMNRIEVETYEEARAEVVKFFETNHLILRIDKSTVGIHVLADKLTRIQANIIIKYLSEIVRKIKEKFSTNVEELNKMPKNLTSITDAVTSFMNILDSI